MSVTEQAIRQAMAEHSFYEHEYENGDKLLIEKKDAIYATVGEIQHLSVCYGEYTEAYSDGIDPLPEGQHRHGYMVCQVQLFPVSKNEELAERFLKQAIDCFIERHESVEPSHATKAGYNYRQCGVIYHNSLVAPVNDDEEGRTLFETSHYSYLEDVIDYFWRLALKKSLDESWCGGIIAAHGDKCYGYRDLWAQKGISFYRGSLLYLLTYTSAMDMPKEDSWRWVILKYPYYLPMIEEAESAALQRYRSLGVSNGQG